MMLNADFSCCTAQVHDWSYLGRRVIPLVDGPRPSGVHQIEWTPGRSQDLSSGVYFCRMQAGPLKNGRYISPGCEIVILGPVGAETKLFLIRQNIFTSPT